MHPMASLHSDILEQHVSRVPAHRPLSRTLAHRRFALGTLVRPVLDIGCIDGRIAAVAFPLCIHVGIDLAGKIVTVSRRNGLNEGV